LPARFWMLFPQSRAASRGMTGRKERLKGFGVERVTCRGGPCCGMLVR
jgi:hypothetical protein